MERKVNPLPFQFMTPCPVGNIESEMGETLRTYLDSNRAVHVTEIEMIYLAFCEEKTHTKSLHRQRVLLLQQQSSAPTQPPWGVPPTDTRIETSI